MIEDMQKSENGKIEKLIYEVRGQYVLLSRDLSKLYNIETRLINQSVKRNIKMFSNKCYFQMTDEEFFDWKSQIVISNGEKMGLRKAPYVFTLEGIKILSTILRKPTIQSTTLEIEEAFKKLENVNSKTLAVSVSKGEIIENLIYNIRGKQIMLDFDLARIYECKNGTKTVVQAFKRNITRFPNDFYFQLTEEEFINLRSQLGTANGGAMSRSLPYAFTEPGVYTLASILRTPIANEITTKIMRTFAFMRKYIDSSLISQKNINDQVLILTNKMDKTDKRIENLEIKFEELQNAFANAQNNKPLTYFEGQIFDAYLKLIEIMNEAKKELIVIDRYADLSVLEMISKVEVNVTLIRGDNNKLNKVDIEKYNTNYNNLTIIVNDTFHDRYIILDKSIIYHCGTSLNSAGARTFSINKWNDEIVVKPFIQKLETIISSSNL